MELSDSNQTLLAALEATYSSADRAERTAAEAYLKDLQSSPDFCQKFCQTLQQPMMRSQQPRIRDYRKAIINCLSKYIQRLWQGFVVNNTTLKKTVIDQLLMCLVSQSITHEDKLQIVAVIAVALVQDKCIHNFPEMLLIKAQQALRNKHMLIACYMLQAVLISTKVLNVTVQLYKGCLGELLLQMIELAGKILPLLNSLNNCIALEECLTLFEMGWRVTTAEVRQLEFDKFKATCLQMIRNEHLFELIMLTLSLAPESHKEQLMLIHSDRLVMKLNKSRERAAEALSHIVTGIRNSKFKLTEISHVVSIYAKLLPALMEKLPNELKVRKQLIEQYSEGEFQYPNDLLRWYLEICAIAARHPEYCDFFAARREHIFCNIVLAMNMPDTQYREQLYSQPMEYVRALIDRCDRQTQGTSKAGASHLLQALLDKVDGTVSYVADIAINFVVCGLLSPGEMPPNMFSSALLSSDFFTGTNWAYKLECGLLLLAEGSYIFDRRKDLITRLEELLNVHIDSLMKYPSPYVTIAFLLFYEYYSDTLYAEGKTMHPTLQKLIQWFLQLTRVSQPPLSEIREEVYATFKEVITEPLICEKFAIHAHSLIEQFIPNLGLSCADKLMGLLIDLFLLFSKVLSTDRRSLLAFIDAISLNVFSQRQPETVKTLLTEKYLQLLTVLAANHDYYPYLEELCVALKPCLPLLRVNSCFHDSIIAVINSCVKSSRKLMPEMSLLLEVADNIIAWNTYSLQRLFETLNMACIYCQSTDTEVIGRVFEVSVHCMTRATEETIPNDLLQGCLLIHNVLFYHHKALTAQMKVHLLRSALRMVDIHHVVLEPDIYSKYLLIFLQLINFDYQLTSEQLKRQARVNNMLSLLFDNVSHYREKYDAKMFAISTYLPYADVIQLLEQRWLEFSQEVRHKIFEKLVQRLQHIFTISNQKPPEKKDTVSSDEDDDDDDNGPIELYETEKATMRVFTSPYKQMDEFALFNRLVQFLRSDERSSALLTEAVRVLKKELSDFLAHTALCVQKVFSDTGVVQPRRIVKVKRQ